MRHANLLKEKLTHSLTYLLTHIFTHSQIYKYSHTQTQTIYSPSHKSLRHCLKYTNDLTMIQNANQIIGKTKQYPTMCFLGSNTIGSKLVRSNK